MGRDQRGDEILNNIPSSSPLRLTQLALIIIFFSIIGELNRRTAGVDFGLGQEQGFSRKSPARQHHPLPDLPGRIHHSHSR